VGESTVEAVGSSSGTGDADADGVGLVQGATPAVASASGLGQAFGVGHARAILRRIVYQSARNRTNLVNRQRINSVGGVPRRVAAAKSK
jgi:hypothetical protein